MSKKIAVIGDGGWGTTLALLLNENGHSVTMWSYSKEYTQKMLNTRYNEKFLPGIELPESLCITCDLESAMTEKDMVVLAIPSKFLRNVLEQVKHLDLQNTIIVSVIKGIENATSMRASEIIFDVFGKVNFAVISGPCIAYEVSRKLPAAVVAASSQEGIAELTQEIFMSERFRVYTSNDVIGVELGGALKNIIAIAAGILDGLGLGTNTKAGLLTRGIVEITRLGVALGANAQTFYGLSGMGDLITTCVSAHGRNRKVGIQIAEGKTLDQIQEMPQVAEGIYTARSVKELSQLNKVEMPIVDEVFSIIYESKDPRKAIQDLMKREKKEEVSF